MCGKKDSVPETPEEITLAKIAKERWDSYKTRFIPVENRAIQNVMNNVNGAPGNENEFLPGVANVDTQSAFSQGEGRLTSGLTARGARPGSGAFMAGIRGLNVDRTYSSALGQSNALGLNRTRNIQNLQALVDLGQGQAGNALAGLTDTAQLAHQQAILDTQASLAARNAIGEAVGTAGGMYYAKKTGGTG